MDSARKGGRAFTLIELLVVIAIILLVVILTIAASIGFRAPPFQAVFYFIFGWIFYLVRVLGAMTVSPVAVGTAVLCVALLAGFLHLLGRSFCRQTWRWRWTVALLGGVALVFGAGLAAVGLTRDVTRLFTTRDRLLYYPQEDHVRRGSSNNLRQIGLGAQARDDATGSLPGCAFDPQGWLLHGWHTMLLPHVEAEHVFKKIDLTRPWDDPNNDPAMGTRVQVYLVAQPEVDRAGRALTQYASNVRLMGGGGQSLKDVRDGLSNTLLIGEAGGNFKPWGHPVGWRDPALGLHTTPDGFGGPYPKKTVFVLADGSVRVLTDDVSPAVLKALSTPAGGEVIEGDW